MERNGGRERKGRVEYWNKNATHANGPTRHTYVGFAALRVVLTSALAKKTAPDRVRRGEHNHETFVKFTIRRFKELCESVGSALPATNCT